MSITTGVIIGSLCLEPICRVTSSAQSIHGIISNIYGYTNYQNIISSLKKLDIEASIRILEKLLKELDIKNKTKTLDESIHLLKKTIMDIENELALVHEQMAYNRSLKYFVWARSYKFTDAISKLENLKNQLDNRTKMLFLILQNSKNLCMKNRSNEYDISIMN
jgi:hypothetical protein